MTNSIYLIFMGNSMQKPNHLRTKLKIQSCPYLFWNDQIKSNDAILHLFLNFSLKITRDPFLCFFNKTKSSF